ncbi:hypothetical protein JA9_002408 [Meyerozyma sp. JA9]|nr:hypothetical protein JA9_002408 [Meyerozyma sp. JA9]
MYSGDCLVAVADLVLNSIDQLNKVEYNRKGRKYKFVNNGFQRVREEDKHLIIFPEQPDLHLGAVSAYSILSNINDGALLEQYPDFCRAVVGTADLLETKGWCEVGDSSVIHYRNSQFDLDEYKRSAFEVLKSVSDEHRTMGLNLMLCAKLNFLHTDHHIGVKVESYYMKYFVVEYFGDEALTSPDILVALKSFVHWGHIGGFLYRLEVPNISLSPQLKTSFDTLPDPVPELKESVHDRYPSGTSKYSLIRKAIDTIADYQYSSLIPYPQEPQFDLQWLYQLCHDIERDPIRYHLRSASKNLCVEPVSLNAIGSKYSHNVKVLLEFVSLVINTFDQTGGEYLLQNSKIPTLTPQLIDAHRTIYQELEHISTSIQEYEAKDWEPDEIVLRLARPEHSLVDAVSTMRLQFSDDYE